MQGRIYAVALLAAVLLASLWGAAALGTPQSDPNAEATHSSRVMPVKAERATVPPGFDRRHIEVKFTDELDIGLSTSGTPMDRSGQQLRANDAQVLLADILFAGGRWQRMTGAAELEIDLLVQNAEIRLNRDIADLNNYFILTVPEGVSTEAWLDRINTLPEVEIALALPLPAPAPLPPNYQGNQGYLGAAPGGIGASASWGAPGGTGAPTTGSPIVVCDFEYSWNLSHDDIPTISVLVPAGYTVSDPFTDNNHGTAVLGELLSLSNGWGTTGASYGVQGAVAPTYLNSAWQLGVAMTHAMTVLGPGDVFLIEQQIQGPNYPGIGPQDGLVPVEWWASWYYTIITAVGNGIHVIEAAGNGREDLDAAVYGVGHAPFLAQNNSGAIIVGAGAVPGGSDTDRSRLSFSNWGSRLNLQGWGEKVYTTGYGTLYSAEGVNRWYTGTFSGTSSASPNVASAVAILESVYESASGGIPFSTNLMRSILTSTGSPQQAGTFPVTQNIGPRPNLVAAISSLPAAPDTCEYYKAPYVDYAPNGMPDFDQKQDQWTSPVSGSWSHCGPAALANCFWWFDSKFEPFPIDPRPFYPGPGNPAPNDGYNLVYSFESTGGLWDDHDTNNVMPLIDSMALYCNTNPPGRSGTYVYDLANGASNWLGAVGLAGAYTVRVYPIDRDWDFDSLRAEVLRSQDVILLLGFWEEMAPGLCERIGGHYVTVAGTCPSPVDSALCISDPYFDKNEGEPPAGSAHGSSVHNDAFFVSGPHGTIHHDRYDVSIALCQPFVPPFFQLELINYPVNAANVPVWQGQNAYDTLIDPITPMGGLIHTILEYAVVICPDTVQAPDTLRNHFKSWRIEPPSPFGSEAVVDDQFMSDLLVLGDIEFLSNPARKDTSDIKRPDDHLNWYRASGRDTLLQVEYENQFGLDTVIIDSVTHLLVPCRKDPHSWPDSLLGHYKSYRIRDGQAYSRPGGLPVEIEDQFDPAPEILDSLVPVYFLTPAVKNGEPRYGPDTHYVAYEIFPKTDRPQSRITEDQFGVHDLEVWQSELLLVPTHKMAFWPVPEPDTLRNHFKSWRISPPSPFGGEASVDDQFMSDLLVLGDIEFLSNPARKDTSDIKRPDDHLNWYRASGRDTLLQVEYENQFGLDTVVIDSVTHLLVPCRKDPHPGPDTLLGHYKSYRVRRGHTYTNPGAVPVEIEDQFNTSPEFIDSLVPVYFLTPAMKNSEPIPNADTHYVAYEIFPKTDRPQSRITEDQFGVHDLEVWQSELLLVPTHKIAYGPPPEPDTLRNHFKSWRIDMIPFTAMVDVDDQFMSDALMLNGLVYLSNPARKDTSDIKRPDDHLNWYRASGRDTLLQVEYENQFGLDTVVIDSVMHLLVPCQKLPHAPPDSLLGHYKSYRVREGHTYFDPSGLRVEIEDQFDLVPEFIDSLVPVLFLTPATKNNEQIPNADTHYVAYEIYPKTDLALTRTTVDQFGSWDITVRRSELLLVPTHKIAFGPPPPEMPPGDDSCWYYKPGYLDYAPNGVPDFDQKQDAWMEPAGLQWTWCGPVSLANCLWWFDAKYDTLSLIPTYGPWPAHDVRNVPPFITDLASCMNVDLVKLGTDVHFMEACVQTWMAAQGYPFLLIEKTYKEPDFLFIEDEIKRSENVILLLGFWELLSSGAYQRVGGHYVTCAGVCSESLWIAISDPYFDMAEGGVGIHAPEVHNDASLISGPHGTNWHDRYRIDTLSASPGGTWWIPDYPITLFAPVATNNFDGQNCPEEFVPQQESWQGGPIFTEVEYAVAISPCPVVATGDVNVDGVLTSADIIYMVNHVFKGGPAPLPCSAAGDVNCDGSLTSADIIYLVNHVFKGGPPPCDVCRLIAAGTWPCP